MPLNRISDASSTDRPSDEKVSKNVVAFIKSTGEKYLFLLDQCPESYYRMAQTLVRFSENDELSLTVENTHAIWGSVRESFQHSIPGQKMTVVIEQESENQ